MKLLLLLIFMTGCASITTDTGPTNNAPAADPNVARGFNQMAAAIAEIQKWGDEIDKRVKAIEDQSIKDEEAEKQRILALLREWDKEDKALEEALNVESPA